jgi:DNA invertase Pin-like site-specific DNA recombinase
MKTVGYVRVSTDKQADRGVSLDAQAEKIRAMAAEIFEQLPWSAWPPAVAGTAQRPAFEIGIKKT